MALRRFFDERFLGLLPQNRLCRGVLILPDDHRTYLRGHRRQALRTNLRKAATAGISCEQELDPGTAFAALEEILAARKRPPDDVLKLRVSWRALFWLPEITLLVARDTSRRPLAVVAAIIDHDVCLIRVAVASDHHARWALHDHLVRELSARGVRYLLADGGGPFGALGYDSELHHYQHLLGYELRHLVPRYASVGEAGKPARQEVLRDPRLGPGASSCQ
jgi:hypothetical protein